MLQTNRISELNRAQSTYIGKELADTLHFESTVNPKLDTKPEDSPLFACSSHSRASFTVSMLLAEVKDKVTTLFAGCNILCGMAISVFLIWLGQCTT